MTGGQSIHHLEGYTNKPVIQDRVLEVVRAAEKPLLMHEVMTRAGVRKETANKCLTRLVKRGDIQRWQIKLHYPNMGTKPKNNPLGAMRLRTVWVYRIAKPKT